MKKSEMINKNMVDNVILEKDILASTKNPYVVELFYAFDSEEHLYLVMEYMIGKMISKFDLILKAAIVVLC
jgi:serine/threonine kinase 38